MKMVIGGAFQGKHLYAERTFGIREGWADGLDCSIDDIFTCKGMKHFHEYVKLLVRENADYDAFVTRLMKENPDICIVCNEMGYGVVPMDKFDRAYREAVGRICEKLAVGSDEVHRVMCGIGTVIKG